MGRLKSLNRQFVVITLLTWCSCIKIKSQILYILSFYFLLVYLKKRQVHMWCICICIFLFYFIYHGNQLLTWDLKNLTIKRFTKSKHASGHVHFPPSSTCRLVWLLNRVQLAESDPLLGKLLNFAIHTCFLCPRAAQFNQSTSFSKLKNEMGCHCSYSLITHRCLKPDDAELGKERKPRGCSGSIRKGLIRTSVITNK